MNFAELLEELRKLDEVTLLELLEVTSEQLVDSFYELVEENETRLIKYFNDEL